MDFEKIAHNIKKAENGIYYSKSESFLVLSNYHLKESYYGNTSSESSCEILKGMEKTRETISSILKELETDFRNIVDVENGK